MNRSSFPIAAPAVTKLRDSLARAGAWKAKLAAARSESSVVELSVLEGLAKEGNQLPVTLPEVCPLSLHF